MMYIAKQFMYIVIATHRICLLTLLNLSESCDRCVGKTVQVDLHNQYQQSVCVGKSPFWILSWPSKVFGTWLVISDHSLHLLISSWVLLRFLCLYGNGNLHSVLCLNWMGTYRISTSSFNWKEFITFSLTGSTVMTATSWSHSPFKKVLYPSYYCFLLECCNDAIFYCHSWYKLGWTLVLSYKAEPQQIPWYWL